MKARLRATLSRSPCPRSTISRRKSRSEPSPVADGELIVGVGRKKFCNMSQSFRKGLGSQQRILAFAQLGVIEVERQGQEVDRDRIRERRLQELCPRALVNAGRAVSPSESPGAELPGVLAGLSANVGQCLVPCNLGE